jgi:hypothetical protein
MTPTIKLQSLSAEATRPLALEMTRLIHKEVSARLEQAAGVDEQHPPLLVPRAVMAEGAATLARSHAGPAARSQALVLYQRCLLHYRQKVQPRLQTAEVANAVNDKTQDDVGAAAAYFVLANLSAVTGVEPKVQTLPAVERQLRFLLSSTQAWQHTDLAQRQALFEQLALLGVLVNESRLVAQQQGAAAIAHVQQAARGYLQQLLGLDADLLSVSVRGLSAVDTVH